MVRVKYEKCIIVWNFNEHVGSSTNGYVGVHGDNGRGKEVEMGKGFFNLLTVWIRLSKTRFLR